MDFSATFGNPQSRRHPANHGATGPRFCIIGNFLADAKLSARSSLQLTAENFEDVLSTISPRLHWGEERLEFKSIEDFHPDSLVQQITPLRELLERYRSIRKDRGASPHLQTVLGEANRPAPTTTEEATPSAASDSGSDFKQLIGDTAPGSPPSVTDEAPAASINQLIRSALDGSEQISEQEIDQVESALNWLEAQLSSGLSAILHHPPLQALEALWRQLDRMMAACEDDMPGSIHLIPLNQSQWDAWIEAPQDAVEAIQRQLEMQGGADAIQRQLEMQGGADAIFLCHRFDCSEKELDLLQQISRLAASAEIPLITSGQSAWIGHETLPEFFGSDEARQIEDSLWSEIKSSLPLDQLYITIQRILTRLPYNPKDDPIESFDYAEDAVPLPRQHFLFAPAPLSIARMWLEYATETASASMPSTTQSIDDSPVYTIDGQLVPVAECWLSDDAANIHQLQGIVPLRSVRNSGQINIFL